MDAPVPTSDTTLIFEGMAEKQGMCLLNSFPIRLQQSSEATSLICKFLKDPLSLSLGRSAVKQRCSKAEAVSGVKLLCTSTCPYSRLFETGAARMIKWSRIRHAHIVNSTEIHECSFTRLRERLLLGLRLRPL